jgi:hypothetical protein
MSDNNNGNGNEKKDDKLQHISPDDLKRIRGGVGSETPSVDRAAVEKDDEDKPRPISAS